MKSRTPEHAASTHAIRRTNTLVCKEFSTRPVGLRDPLPDRNFHQVLSSTIPRGDLFGKNFHLVPSAWYANYPAQIYTQDSISSKSLLPDRNFHQVPSAGKPHFPMFRQPEGPRFRQKFTPDSTSSRSHLSDRNFHQALIPRSHLCDRNFHQAPSARGYHQREMPPLRHRLPSGSNSPKRDLSDTSSAVSGGFDAHVFTIKQKDYNDVCIQKNK